MVVANKLRIALGALFLAPWINMNPGIAAWAGEESQAGQKRPHMDVAFCIDTTGSMQGEIDVVKSKVKEMVAKLSAGKPAPVIRVGLVAYRDRGDEYVTKVFPFSDDIDKVVKDISGLVAYGGGDQPEAVNQAMHALVNDLSWDKSHKTAKLAFLIGDAGPHAYPNDYNWKDEAKKAISEGIQINTIGCNGLEATDGEAVFRQIASMADGKYDSLAYKREMISADGRRETIVTTGSGTYKIKGDARSWKAAAVAGRMEPVNMAAAAAPMSLKRSRSLAAPAAAIGGAAGEVAGSLDRKDSNLDEVMLQAAKAKASKSLNIDYSH